MVVLLLAVGLMGWVSGPVAAAGHGTIPPHIVRNFESGVARNPPVALQVAAIKRLFPEDFERLLQSVWEEVGPRPTQAAYTSAFHANLDAFIRRTQPALASAPSEWLRRAIQTERDWLIALERSAPDQCPAASAGKPMELLGRGDLELANAQLLVSRLEAARAGLDSPAQRDLDATRQDDMTVLRATTVATVDPKLRALLRDPSAMQRATPGQFCAVNIAILDGLLSLPEEQGARLMAGYLTSPEAATGAPK